MELKRRLDPRNVFVGVVVLITVIYFTVGLSPAEATNYEITSQLSIPSIGLTSDVTRLKLENKRLETPDTIVGSYSQAENKTLLIGHSTTVFNELEKIKSGDEITYEQKKYRVVNIEVLAKAEISMNKILKPAEKDTIMIMTCAGELYDGGDASHRLIIEAVAD